MGTLFEVSGTSGAITVVCETKDKIISDSISANQDDYNPTGLATCNVLRVDSDQNGREIRGIVAPAAGINKAIWFFNINTDNYSITFMDNNGSATAANRLLIRDRQDKDLKEQEGMGLWYDHIVSRWRTLTRIG